jgi:hypothetical protein
MVANAFVGKCNTMYFNQNIREDINNHLQCYSSEFEGSCSNCILMKEQLYIAQQELESARTVIAHLHDVVREVTAQDVTNIVKTSLSNKLSVNDLDEDNWTPVVHNFIKKTNGNTNENGSRHLFLKSLCATY